MKINKETTIEFTVKDIEDIIKKHINKEGYIVEQIAFNVSEHIIERDPIDDRLDITKLMLDGCVAKVHEATHKVSNGDYRLY